VGRGVFLRSLGPSWQSAPLKPGQHLHSNCVTVLYLVTYLGLKFTRYLQMEGQELLLVVIIIMSASDTPGPNKDNLGLPDPPRLTWRGC
jgi:hypothetical protein